MAKFIEIFMGDVPEGVILMQVIPRQVIPLLQRNHLSILDGVVVFFISGFVTVIPIILLLPLLGQKIIIFLAIILAVTIILRVEEYSPWRNLLVAIAIWLGTGASMLMYGLIRGCLSQDRVYGVPLMVGLFLYFP